MSGTTFPTLLSFLSLLSESVRTVVRVYADVITKFSGIDRFLFSIPSHDGYGAPLRARTLRYEVIQELQVMSGAYHPQEPITRVIGSW